MVSCESVSHALSLRFFHDFNTCALEEICRGFPLITRLGGTHLRMAMEKLAMLRMDSNVASWVSRT